MFTLRSSILQLAVIAGILPADTLLLYNETQYEWMSGFGEFAGVCYALVRSAKPQTIVEVGSAYGKSTCFIAAALQRNRQGRLYSIDPHQPTKWNDGRPDVDTYSIVTSRLKQLRLSQYVQIVRKFSSEAAASWDVPIDILLLDGSHTYEDVKADFMGFLPSLRPGALILFHDTMWKYHQEHPAYRQDQGVPQFVQELQDQGYPMVTLREGWGLTVLQNSPNGFKLTN